MARKNEASSYLTRLNGVSLEKNDTEALLALAESVDDLVARGAEARLEFDGVPWSFDTLRAEHDDLAKVRTAARGKK